tara:strand:- start:235 stop:504 length:270 start_codon:yes stop_codon:yes gene_type:complete
MKEYKRLANVLAEALRVNDEEPKSSNAYVRALKESDRYHRPVGGWQPGAPKLSLKKKKEKLTTKDKVLAQVAAGSGSKKAAEALKKDDK